MSLLRSIDSAFLSEDCSMVARLGITEPLHRLMQAKVDASTQTVLQRLVALHGITTILTALGDFLMDGYVSPVQVRGLPISAFVTSGQVGLGGTILWALR